MARTPSPWLVPFEDVGAVVAAGEAEMSLLGLDQDGMAIFMNRDDAVFAVEAGNAHDELLDALAAILPYAESRAEDIGDMVGAGDVDAADAAAVWRKVEAATALLKKLGRR